jgi:glycosidase
VCRELHRRGIRVVFDAVFHHTGRDFWAFRDVQEKRKESPYCNWYHLDFTRRSPYGEPFHYKGWAGHYDLAKLNVANPETRDHLFAAVRSWIEQFEIDGLRLDAADVLDLDFQGRLAAHCRELKADFWLMGEVVGGDYRRLAYPGGLDSTTNYEAYKGLWSSHNDRNYFEIAYSLDREFGPGGIYRGLPLYAFADNHDVDRVSSILQDLAHLYPLYILLMTMPGVPSIYYGSECGIEGRKGQGTDAPLRPALDPQSMLRDAPHPDLHRTIKKLIALRRRRSALRRGEYIQLHVAREQFAFLRHDANERIVVALNASSRWVELPLTLPDVGCGRAIDELNSGESFEISGGTCRVPIPPRWGRILVTRQA